MDGRSNKRLTIFMGIRLPFKQNLIPSVADITQYSSYVACNFWLLRLCRCCSCSLECHSLLAFNVQILPIFKNLRCQDSQTSVANELAACWTLCSIFICASLMTHDLWAVAPPWLDKCGRGRSPIWIICESRIALCCCATASRQESANNQMSDSVHSWTPASASPLLRSVRNV